MERKRRKASQPKRTTATVGTNPRLCAFIKKNGEQCRHEPKRNSRYCALHARRELMRRIESAPHQDVYEIDPDNL